MSRRLRVLLYDRHIGDVVQSDQGAHSFRYRDEYLASEDRTPLSLSMPLAPVVYPKKRIDPWMLGLLPDGDDVHPPTT